MKKMICLIAGLCSCLFYASSQETDQDVNKFAYFIRLNFTDLASGHYLDRPESPVTSPIICSYSLNSKSSGWGVNVAMGYDGDPLFTSQNVDHQSIRSRSYIHFGPEKIFRSRKPWIIMVGIHGFLETRSNTHKEHFGAPFTGMTRHEFDHRRIRGLGAHASVHYALGKYIMVGAELLGQWGVSKNHVGFREQEQTTQEVSSSSERDREVITAEVKYPIALLVTATF